MPFLILFFDGPSDSGFSNAKIKEIANCMSTPILDQMEGSFHTEVPQHYHQRSALGICVLEKLPVLSEVILQLFTHDIWVAGFLVFI